MYDSNAEITLLFSVVAVFEPNFSVRERLSRELVLLKGRVETFIVNPLPMIQFENLKKAVCHLMYMVLKTAPVSSKNFPVALPHVDRFLIIWKCVDGDEIFFVKADPLHCWYGEMRLEHFERMQTYMKRRMRTNLKQRPF